MQFREIAAISGKPGLYRILKPTQGGVIMEALDEKKARFVAGATSKVSMLSEISMFTYGGEGSVPLPEVMYQVHEQFAGKALPVTAKSDGADLEDFFSSILPDWDKERVYTSDIKKLVSWYGILAQFGTAVLVKPVEERAIEEKVAIEATVSAKPELEAAAEAKPAKKAKATKTETAETNGEATAELANKPAKAKAATLAQPKAATDAAPAKALTKKSKAAAKAKE